MSRRRRLRFATRCALIVWVAVLFVTFERRVSATNDENHIQEIMAGANGNSKIQFIVIKQEGGGNCWGPQVNPARAGEQNCFFGGANETQSRVMLVFFDSTGRETGKFKFTKSPPNNSNQTLIATQDFADLTGAPTPDFIMPPLLSPISGKVCFTNNPANANAFARNDCLSYGSFPSNMTGTSEFGFIVFGSPAAALPIVNTSSLKRTGNPNGFGSTTNSNFTVVTPTPRNNAGATFTIPVKTQIQQGDTLFNSETFLGNGRACGNCHVSGQSLRLPPSNIQSRFTSLASPTLSFDPLFIAETNDFDFNLNTLVVSDTGNVILNPATQAVTTGPVPSNSNTPCTGELRGIITSTSGGITRTAKVLTRVSANTYLIYGGKNPTLTGTVSDTNSCSATVSSVTTGSLGAIAGSSTAGLEDPLRMRTSVNPSFPQGRGLILENIDGLGPPLTTAVFRKSPHLLNLNNTAPYGFSGDVPDLQTFATGAVKQHFPRTLTRNTGGSSPDSRLPTAAELAAMEAFMLDQKVPADGDFTLTKFATTAAQKRGKDLFFGSSAKCSQCHGGTVLAATTVVIQGKAIGINAAFNTGVVNQPINGAGVDNNIGVSCEKNLGTGACGSREFSVPQLFNVKNLGPFFHDASSPDVASTVEFYASTAFASSPAGVAIGGIAMNTGEKADIVAFLNSLVVRPFTRSATTLNFGHQITSAGPTAAQSITVTNTSSSGITFTGAPSLAGTDQGEFGIASSTCPTTLAAGANCVIQVTFDPSTNGSKSAVVEINAPDPSGVNLFGSGGTPAAFTDDTLVAGTDAMRAVHITEMRSRINTLRTAAGLATFSFTDASLTTGTTAINAQHIAELRTALNAVYDAREIARPTFTDSTITAGSTVIKRVHITELRAAIQDLE